MPIPLVCPESPVLGRFLLLGLLLLTACMPKEASVEAVHVGAAAPHFSLKALSGSLVDLADQRGKVLLLRFWSMRCQSCVKEMPRLEALFQRLRPSGMTVIAINVEDSPEDTAAFAEKLGITYPMLLDDNKMAQEKYQAFSVPLSFVISKEGIIKERFFGEVRPEVLEKIMKSLL